MTQDSANIHTNINAAEDAVEGMEGIPQRELTDEERGKLADFILAFSQQMCGVELYPYELEFGWRICYSLLVEDSDEITALFSRQSGKTETVAVVVCGLCVLLPVLAKAFPKDERVSKFKNGLWAGIFAPNYRQAGIMWGRMKARMYSKAARATLLDPDIDIDLDTEKENMALPNGSFVDCGTASPQSSIEGETYHLIILEECQDIDSNKIRSSIHPMAAATAGTLVKIGTCDRKKSDFYSATRRNKRKDVRLGLARSRTRTHFQFDYTIAQRYNPKYRKYVEKERERLGEDSDDFRMKYKLHWLLSRGMFVDPDQFEECGIKEADSFLEAKYGRGRRMRTIKFSRPQNIVTYDQHTPGLCAAVDVGKGNSTVITVGKPFLEGKQFHGTDPRYPLHIYNWKELQGDDHEAQQPQIIDFLLNYKLKSVIVDATGKGDPVYSRIAADLEGLGIEVIPFIFSTQSKDVGYKIFSQEIRTGRFTFPAGNQAARHQKWQRFYQQMCDLEKSWRGGTMIVEKPDDKDARDDFPDSAMMLNWLVNGDASQEVEMADNPLVGRTAGIVDNSIAKGVKNWYEKRLSPAQRRARGTRNGRSGKWG